MNLESISALVVGWAFLLFGGMLFGQFNEEETHRSPKWARMLSSLFLVYLAIVIPSPEAVIKSIQGWLILGITFGFIGDLFMARLLIRHDSFVLFGMGAFGIGHIFYSAFGLQLVQSAPLPFVYLVAWGIAILLWYVLLIRKNQTRESVHMIALPYALLLATTPSVFINAALNNPSLQLNLSISSIGAILFLVSDLLLAVQLFRGLHFKGIGDIVWVLYGTGQLLIVMGINTIQ